MREKDWWKEPIETFGMRTLFHALSEYDGDDVWEDILGYVMERPWMIDLKDRFATVREVEHTAPWQSEDEDLLQTLYLLYAASRVRDVLVFARQPPPLDPQMQRGLDEWLNRTEPSFELLPIDRFEAFFEHVGCRSTTVPFFDPILHEIVVCDQSDRADDDIVVIEQLWPALLIGELVFARAGVRVRAGSARARAGVADRSPMYWEHWRRHRRTFDLSMGWGTNSQWGTRFRRDYLTDSGRVFNFDALVQRRGEAREATEAALSADQLEELVKNRCMLRSHDELNHELWPYDSPIGERRP